MKNILSFLHLAEKLKKELRHNWLSDGRRESAAEHTWRVSLMALVMYSKLKEKIDLEKALKIAIVHDLPEAEAYDIPAQDAGREAEKEKIELAAMKKAKIMLGGTIGEEIFALWEEFEGQKTPEAKFIKALDKMEVRLQHNESDVSTWDEIEYPRSLYVADKFCEYDDFLKEFNGLIKADSVKKIEASGQNIEEIKKSIPNM